ncbi:MAG: YihY/virulence factor BrkB family protein [Ilumatobacter sp.]|uniref:YihY/virulence factor BrkB family protein n=1 Tax=Ilumatobacter sp. TaxID=1967498 RepID=UPI0032991FFE
MAWTTSDTVMTYRERYRAVDVFAEMMDGWRRHLSGRNASLLAFFTFLSIFPLMLAAVTILGYLLEGDPELRQRIVDSAASEIPVIGDDFKEVGAIQGSVLGLAVGLGGALWSSTKAFVGLQGALDDTWEIPVDDRAGMPAQRGKALLGLAIISASQIGSLVVASIISEAGLPVIGTIALIAVTVVINILVIASMYRFLTSYTPTWSDVWLGAIIAGIVFTVLQQFGPRLVKQFAEGPDAFAVINTVIGLITWLSLVGITVIMCAELNAARKRLGDGTHVQRGAEMNIAIRN